MPFQRFLYQLFFLLFLFFTSLSTVFSQQINDTITFKATVYFFFNEEVVENARVRTSVDTVYSNQKGYFEIRVSKRDTVFVWFPGFNEINAPIKKFGNIESFYLKEDKSTMLDEVVVGKQREHYLKKFVPQDTIKFYTETPRDSIIWGKDRSYTGLISELAAQFSKKEQERRKYLDITAEARLTAVYWKVLGDPNIQKQFTEQYGITETEFINYKLFFHETNVGLQRSTNENKIRKAFYDQYINYLRYYKYQK